MNRGGVGARSLNIELQAALNPAGDRKVERFGWTFAPGDKVMQIENDYDKEVYNGDIGIHRLQSIPTRWRASSPASTAESVTYGFGELDALVLAYAATIHKSQGSEYPAVVILVMTQHYTMLQRNLLYTGNQPGVRSWSCWSGRRRPSQIAVRNVLGRRRWSKLNEWLHPYHLYHFVQADDPETAVARIIELVKTRIPKRFGLDPIRDIQVLCPMNRGGVGARSLNIELQAALNPAGDHKVERFGWTFAPGDKVMQIENDYDKEVYNGDIGNIDCINPADGELVANFDGRAVTYGFGELDMLVPAYAATIHKSQGSEYPAVVIPIMTQHYAMLQRNLLYTGVTRGKRLVVLVGQKKAVAIAVRNVSGRRRWSKLQEWLRPNPIFIAADRYGNEHKGAHAQPGLFVASNLT